MPIRVGLPQGLMHYYYGRVWENFFHRLGAEVLLSGDTTKAMLNAGGVLDDVCLPVKAYFGHVCQIYKEVDCLFVPRIVSVTRHGYACPKLMGLADMLKSNISNLPPLLASEVNSRHFPFSMYQMIIEAGRMAGVGAFGSLLAWYRAWDETRNIQNAVPADACGTNGPKLALIGHPYIIYDRQIGMDIVHKLQAMDVRVVTPQTVEPGRIKTALSCLDKKPYWSYCGALAGAALALMEQKKVDGMILMTSFSCGPDSLLGEIVKRQAEKHQLPFMGLSVDEHTAEAGFITRLEAYVDMLIRRENS